MMNYKDKILYCFALVTLLFIGVGVGYIKTITFGQIKVNNTSVLEFARDYSMQRKNNAVTASTKTYDITVVYDDYYTVCDEDVISKNIVYGSTLDKVKEDEKKYQEENGLEYKIQSEEESKIVFYREIKENCPNHFKVISEDGKIQVYQIKGEDKSIVYMTIENVNVSNLRDELRQKVEKGTYINSREELNSFIEDLES